MLRILKRENSLTPTFDQLLTLEEYYDLVGLKEQLAREEGYDKAAAALVQKRAWRPNRPAGNGRLSAK